MMEEKQIVENVKPGLDLGIEAIFKIHLIFSNQVLIRQTVHRF